METCLDLTAVAIRFVKYVDFADSLRRYAIFEIGRVGNIELKALEKAYASQLCRLPGDLTNGILQKKVHHNSGCYTVRICLFIGNILEGVDLIEKESDASKVTITYAIGNIRPSLKSIKCMTAYGKPWFERFPVDWDAGEETDTFKNKLEVLAHLFEDFPHATRCANITHKNTQAFLAVRLGYIVFDIGCGRFITIVQQKHEPELLDLILTDTSVNQVWILNQVSSIVEDEKSCWWWTSGFPYVRGEDILSEIAALQIDIVTFLADRKDRYQKLAAHILENHEDSTSTETTKTNEENVMDCSREYVDKPFIGQKISFDDKAPKKWVDLYTLLYDHFTHWCHRVDATLQQRTFSYSNKAWYPAGINFYIMKRNSSDGKDKLKFSVLYEELTEQVTMRFFAENVDIVVDGHQIHESVYCEPIISVFLFDKPKEGVKMFDITNGDQDNKMDHGWKPLDVLKAYFGDTFWDNIIEIFGKFIPKQIETFKPDMENSPSADTTKTKEENVMNSEKIKFPESAPKKWVSLYGDLHELFSTWCRKREATLEESVFASSYLGYPVGIVFRISRKFSSDSKDELKFTLNYDNTFKTVAIRIFADNIESFYVTTPKERLQIKRITFCEPIFKSFIGDKPSEHQIYGSQTNGDPESKTSADWKPIDVIREYFGTGFLDKIGEIFGKYVPKETTIFEPSIILKWELCSEYKFFNELRTEIDRYFKRWFSEDVSVSQIIVSENKVAWEIQMTNDRKYRAELTHDINHITSYGIHNAILRFFKQRPGFEDRKLAMYELDYEFGDSFYHGIERIYEYIRMKVLNIVNAETPKLTLPKSALSEDESYIWSKEEFKKITEDLKKLAESTSKEEKKMNEKKELEAIVEEMTRYYEMLKMEKQESKPNDSIFPHFSTSKDGVKLVTIPWDVYRTMTNTQYGMTTSIVKDHAFMPPLSLNRNLSQMIKDSYWNQKTGVATIIWTDGSKTMSKPMEGTTPDPEIGFAMCIAKKMMGGTQNKWRKWLKGVVDASAASAKKKSDKNRIKLEKQARAQLLEDGIDNPDKLQIEATVETIMAKNATTSEKNQTKKKPRRKKSTN